MSVVRGNVKWLVVAVVAVLVGAGVVFFQSKQRESVSVQQVGEQAVSEPTVPASSPTPTVVPSKSREDLSVEDVATRFVEEMFSWSWRDDRPGAWTDRVGKYATKRFVKDLKETWDVHDGGTDWIVYQRSRKVHDSKVVKVENAGVEDGEYVLYVTVDTVDFVEGEERPSEGLRQDVEVAVVKEKGEWRVSYAQRFIDHEGE